jgi:hypothetical protein
MKLTPDEKLAQAIRDRLDPHGLLTALEQYARVGFLAQAFLEAHPLPSPKPGEEVELMLGSDKIRATVVGPWDWSLWMLSIPNAIGLQHPGSVLATPGGDARETALEIYSPSGYRCLTLATVEQMERLTKPPVWRAPDFDEPYADHDEHDDDWETI